MSSELLTNLRSEQFHIEVGALVPPASLRLVLARNHQVRALVSAIGTGTVTEQNIRDFVGSILEELRPREPLDHDLALAAIAVALEGFASQFADQFISDLASVSIIEMRLGPSLARECLNHRSKRASTFQKTFVVEHAVPRALAVRSFVDTGTGRRSPKGMFITVGRELRGAA